MMLRRWTTVFIVCLLLPAIKHEQMFATLPSRTFSAAMWFHPLPDGHIYRDIQVIVDEEKIDVDVRLSSSDVTWIELIKRIDFDFQQSVTPAAAAAPSEDQEDVGNQPEDKSDQSESLKKIRSLVNRENHLPLPTTEDEVSHWLTQPENRKVLQWWIAKHVHAQWGEELLEIGTKISARQNGRHHWAISVEVQFPIPEAETKTDDAIDFQLTVDAFDAYPGMVRRAIKSKGDVFIESTQLPPLVVRADFQTLDEKSTKAERTEKIEATLRIE